MSKRQQEKKHSEIQYIREDIPEFKMPGYKGERYEAMVPDTLDLQERAALGINGLTAPTDEAADYEIYWMAFFRHNPPMMQHDWSDGVQVKFMEALPLLRLVSGSHLNKHVEKRWMEVLLQMQGPDGLLYFPKRGRPWWKIDCYGPEPPGEHYTSPIFTGRLLGAMTIYYLLTKEEVWKETGERVVDGLRNLVIYDGNYATFAWIQFGPGGAFVPADQPPLCNFAAWLAWTIQELINFFKATGYDKARDLAGKLSRWVVDKSNAFGAESRFLKEPGGPQQGRPERYVHFHGHTMILLGLLEYAIAADDKALIEFVRKGYEYGKANGESLVGYFPEHLEMSTPQTSEICEVADMIALGLKLTKAGVGDYWDDVDRWVRNQFAEGQLTRTDWIFHMLEGLPRSTIDETYQTKEQVPERNVGAFAGWPSANDWQGLKQLDALPPGRSIMHCCTGNATRAIYYVWENILNYTDGKLKVNLLLNRASPWADLDSYIPYEGRVDIKIKAACDLSLRIPEWVTPAETQVKVADEERSPSFDGRYARVGNVKPSDMVTLTFPISECTDVVNIEGENYTLVRKGNEVVYIDPPGKYCPLYQRDHYRQKETHFRKTTRFVSDKFIPW